MSGGPRPPVPGLIPLAALSRRPGRPRRRTESIDEGVGSRCTEARASAAPGRRRHRRRRASCKQSRSSSPALDRPPRVNPIFVWVRQENTRIVDVKCEDYDKRNRILLTKTAHGWRAIPRTEMLAAPRASAEEQPLAADQTDVTPPPHHHHRHHHHKRKSKKPKSHQSTSVQFPESEPSWVTSESVNIESLLPSHTIQIKRIPSSENLENSVNIASEQEFARRTSECSTPDKVCDVTPLDNLLAVAELELKQHMQSGNWSTNPETSTDKSNISHELHEDLTTNSEEKSEECSYNDDDEMSMNDILSRLEQSLQSPHGFGSESAFDDEDDTTCKFQQFDDEEEEENTGVTGDGNTLKNKNISKTSNKDQLEVEVKQESLGTNSEPRETENTILESNQPSEELQCKLEPSLEPPEKPQHHKEVVQQPEPQQQNEQTKESKPDSPHYDAEPQIENEVAEAEPSISEQRPPSPGDEGICLDLSLKSKLPPKEDQDSGPTDLCIRKREPSPKMQPPRPASQNSEAIQSPQPSGIPAVPASPDIVTTTTMSKPRSIFLESLLATKTASNASELNKSKEPLDLGQQCRKSASPTVTCSQEIVDPSSNGEPPAKKLKENDDITLKNLLDKDVGGLLLEQHSKKPTDKAILQDTPRLLSLLNASSDTEDPLAEFKQLLLEIDIPNPLMVPKDVFPDLLKHPRREILKILSGHSSKNVPLDDILVVYKDKLLAAIKSSLQSKKNVISSEKLSHNKHSNKTHSELNNNHNDSVSHKRKVPPENSNKPASDSNKTTLANDIDAANEAAFNPLFWSGFPNPFEALNNYSNHNELLQALYAASSMPYMHNQLGELHPSLQMMLGNKMPSPLGFPPLPPLGFNNPIELSMWQEAMMQASLLKNNSNMPQRPAVPQQKKTHHHTHQSNKFTTPSAVKTPAMVHPSFNNNQSSWQNPYLGLGGFPPGNTNNLSVDTQFNPFSHKNNISPSSRHNNQQLSPSVMQKKNKEVFPQFADQEKRMHQQMMQEHQKMQQIQQQKLLRQHQQQIYQQQLMMQNQNGSMGKKSQTIGNYGFLTQETSKSGEVMKQGGVSAPIDLSGVQNVAGRPKASGAKSNGLVSSSRSLVEDVPEVGSTTEDNMQDGHAQLWHPLFGR